MLNCRMVSNVSWLRARRSYVRGFESISPTLWHRFSSTLLPFSLFCLLVRCIITDWNWGENQIIPENLILNLFFFILFSLFFFFSRTQQRPIKSRKLKNCATDSFANIFIASNFIFILEFSPFHTTPRPRERFSERESRESLITWKLNVIRR